MSRKDINKRQFIYFLIRKALILAKNTIKKQGFISLVFSFLN